MVEIFSFGASTAAGSKDDTGGGFICSIIFSMIDNTRFTTFIHSDGMHFNAKGHEFIADQIWQYLETNHLFD